MIAGRVNMCILTLFQNIHSVPLSEFLRYEISFYIGILFCRGQAVFLSSGQFVTVGTIIIVQSDSVTTNFFVPGYQKLNYIQSSGTQYINTGFIASNTTKIKINMGGRATSVSRYGVLFGSRKTWSASNWNDSKGFCIGYDKQTTYFIMFGRGYNSDTGTIPNIGIIDGNNHIVELGSDGLFVDGLSKMNLEAYTFTSPVALTIFADNRNGTIDENGSYKLYNFKIFDSGTLVRDFVPAKRKSDNVVGLMDLKNKVFYTNAGSGTFNFG